LIHLHETRRNGIRYHRIIEGSMDELRKLSLEQGVHLGLGELAHLMTHGTMAVHNHVELSILATTKPLTGKECVLVDFLSLGLFSWSCSNQMPLTGYFVTKLCLAISVGVIES
jgi:hypothetical protein